MPENRLWWAHLFEGSPRYAIWRRIFGSDSVPLKAPRSFQALFGEERASVEAYAVAVEELSVDQRNRLIEDLSTRFNCAPSEVAQALIEDGLPIRAADVVVTFSLRAFV